MGFYFTHVAFLIGLTPALVAIANVRSGAAYFPGKLLETESQSRTPSLKVQEQQKKVAETIEGLEPHPWAGDYYCGSGLGSNQYLLIEPDQFVYIGRGCQGVYAENYGTVSVSNGIVRLKFQLENDLENGGLSTMLVQVQWGSRQYLIPIEKLIAFSHDCRSGREPRSQPYGEYFLRKGDHKKLVNGPPEMPNGYACSPLPGPIKGRIVEILTRHFDDKTKLVLTKVRINSGRDKGVYEGMIWRIRGRHPLPSLAQVASVENEHSLAVFSTSLGEEPKVGWKLARLPFRP